MQHFYHNNGEKYSHQLSIASLHSGKCRHSRMSTGPDQQWGSTRPMHTPQYDYSASRSTGRPEPPYSAPGPSRLWNDEPLSASRTMNPTSSVNYPWIPMLQSKGFNFRKREKHLDVRHIAAVDLNRLVSGVDLMQLETLMTTTTFGDLPPKEVPNWQPNDLVLLVRVMQLQLEYLLATRTAYAEKDRQASLEAQKRPPASSSYQSQSPGPMNNNNSNNNSNNDSIAAALAAEAASRADLQRQLAQAMAEIGNLRNQLSQTAEVLLTRDVERERKQNDQAEEERQRQAKTFELEERNRKLRLEQELFNKERLVNLEKERLERAKLALDLEQQKQEKLQNRNMTDLIEMQRQLAQQIQAHSLILSQFQLPNYIQVPQPVVTPVPVPPPPADAAAPLPSMPPPPPSAPSVSDDYKLYLSGTDFPKTDWFSLCDPFIVVFTASKSSVASYGKNPSPGWSLHSMTPVIWDTSNPIWTMPVVIRWDVNDDLAIQLQVWDAEVRDPITPHNYQKQEFVGSCQFHLRDVNVPEKIGKTWGFKMLDTKGKPVKKAAIQVRCVSQSQLDAEEKARLDADLARSEAERKAREEAEERERRRREDEARLRAEMDAQKRRLEEEEARRKEHARLLCELRELQDRYAEKEKRFQHHDAMKAVFAERMNAMVAYQLSASAKNLPPRSMSDAYVALLSTELQKGLDNTINAQPQKFVAMTEVAKNSLNPIFYRPLLLACPSFEDQMLEFQAYQDDSNGRVDNSNFDKQSYVGSVTLNLAQLVAKPGTSMTIPFSNKARQQSASLTVKLVVDDAACAAWKQTAITKIDEYNTEGLGMQAELKAMEQQIENLKKRISDVAAASVNATASTSTSTSSAGTIPLYNPAFGTSVSSTTSAASTSTAAAGGGVARTQTPVP